MSIHDYTSKIKGRGPKDPISLVYLAIIGVVGISAFGLGRMSVYKDTTYSAGNSDTKDSLVSTENKSETLTSTNKSAESVSDRGVGNYVASKNGKLYYKPTCKGANRIKPENQVWFKDAIDAEKSGYKPSASCK